MAINTGVNVSKLTAYAVLAPMPGLNVTKLTAYAVLAPMPGLNVTKLTAYAVLASVNSNPPLWPVWAASYFADGYVGVPYSQSWDMPSSAVPVTYSLLSGTLPPGVTIQAIADNQAKLAGTPTTAGTYAFTLRAVNLFGFANKAFSITVNPAPAALVVPVAVVLHDGTVGRAYSETLSAQGGTSPYSYTVTGGALPDGLSLSSDTISGTPSAAGTYSFTIEVTDSAGNIGSQNFSITIDQPAASGGIYTFSG